MNKFLSKYKSHLLFLLIFSLAFFAIKLMFLYFLPFLIGFFVSALMYPVYRYMKKRLSFKPAFSATVITLFIFSVVIAVITFMMYLLIRESIHLYNNNIDFFSRYINGIDFSGMLSQFDFSSDMFSKLSDTAFGIVRIIPLTITLLIISFVSTICIINNLSNIRILIISRLSAERADAFSTIIDKSSDIFKKFARSYLLLYMLTFVESVFIFKLIGIKYVLVFAFLATVADLLPIFGPGTVYLPIAVIKIVTGDYLSGITLVIFWAIVLIIRQIIEPKIVSDSIRIHPIVIFSALYFSIVSSELWVLFYIILLAVLYKILIESDVLKPLFFDYKSSKNKGC